MMETVLPRSRHYTGPGVIGSGDSDEELLVSDRNQDFPVDNGNTGTTGLAYEEFFGGAISCPTCHGTGKVPRDMEHELVAIIPMSDKRLRPRRTVHYVLMAVFLCIVIGTLLLFFLFPRSVVLESNKPTLTPTYIGVNETKTLTLTVVNRYNLTNSNYFSVAVKPLEVKMVLFSQTIIATATNDSLVMIPLRSSRLHYIEMNVTFTDEYIVTPCKAIKGRLLLIPFQATATFYYFDKEELSTLNTFQYIRCHPADMNLASYANIIDH